MKITASSLARIALPLGLLAVAPAARAAGEDDALVRRALEGEMTRSMKELRIPGEPAPHYMVYTLTDVEQADASASFGAGRGSSSDSMRFIRVEVRVGTAKEDSGNFVDPQLGTSPMGFALPVPLTDDYFGLRKKLWLRSDDAYKAAIKLHAQKRAAAKVNSRGPQEAPFDFAESKPASTTFAMKGSEEPIALDRLSEIARALSAVGRDLPEIHECWVSAKHYRVRRRVLTSEGGWKDERSSFVDIEARAVTQAEDGMPLRDRVGFDGTGPSSLPALADMVKGTRQMAEALVKSRQGSIPGRSSAVVLFEGQGAAQLTWLLLANHISGTPPPGVVPGSSHELPVEDFADNIGQRIAPPFLDVWDDPLRELGPDGKALLGAYQADDETVPAERITLVDKGILKTLLMSRTPRKEILRSNGHGRGRSTSGAVRGHWGVLTLSAGKTGQSDAQLRARAVKEAAADGPETPVYVVRSLQASLVGPEGARGGLRPYSIFLLKGGKEEPVRGVSLTSIAPRSLREIVAAGKQLHTFHLYDGAGADSWRLSTILAPSLLLKNVEVRGDTRKQPKPPLYARPALPASTAAAP